MWDYYYYDAYAAKKPRKTKGGIKAHSRRGEFGQNWWSNQWANVMDIYDSDMVGGKTYARQGQVLSINIEKCNIYGTVQGSKRRPYTVMLKMKKIDKHLWRELVLEMSRRPSVAAALMAGRIPDGVEDIFNKKKVCLIPDGWDVEQDCSCYKGGYCKHVYAVWLLVAEQTDRDPFLIFKMAGMEREELIKMAGLETQDSSQKSNLINDDIKIELLPTKHSEFWGKERQVQDDWQVRIPALHAALPKHLGNFPYWRGSEEFMPLMEEIYQGASIMGLGTFIGKE